MKDVWLKLAVISENTVGTSRGIMGGCGLSIYIEAGGMKILFDTGESGVLLNNADMMGIYLPKNILRGLFLNSIKLRGVHHVVDFGPELRRHQHHRQARQTHQLPVCKSGSLLIRASETGRFRR